MQTPDLPDMGHYVAATEASPVDGDHDRLKGRIVRKQITCLYWNHVIALKVRAWVGPDEFRHDMQTIATACGFPPGQDSIDTVASWVLQDAGVTPKVRVAS